MSSVGLPRVPSVRSSSRGSLNSAGSDINSQRSGSCSAEADQNSDAEEEEGPQEEGALWQDVENFLNKPAPSLNIITKGDNLNREILPKIKDQRSSLRKGISAEPQFDDTPFRKKATRTTTISGPAQPKMIDPKLLEEAFAYAKKVQMQSMNDSDDEQDNGSGQELQQSQRGSSNTRMAAPFVVAGEVTGAKNSARIGSFSKQTSFSKLDSDAPKKKKSSKSSTKTSVYGAQIKPKSSKINKKQREQQWDMTHTSSAEATELNRKASMDPQMMQALVSNFQNGTTLDELRRELAASQQSMAASRTVIQDAAKSFFGGKY